ncbi:MAG: aminotransferase class I/II-fold pyridoxal phosphate-dependent enzyme, partial [bacterium]|nr:aminotransferase class I/II-fold pyridoxal phosphate-dependent enzyme [bacterium]
MNKHLSQAFATRCIHAGQHPDKETGAIMTPIYMSSTYVQDGPGKHKGFEYSRTQNPTRNALQDNIAALENGSFGFCFSSGCAATTTLLMALSAGDHVIAVDDLYGGTYRLFTKVFMNKNITSSFIDMSNISNLKKAFNKNTKLIWIETPTNPMLKLVDIAAICTEAHKHGALVVVDNTFATPYLQQPLELGADFVIHSTTKYIGGHSDVIGGAIVTNNKEWAQKIDFLSNSIGAIPSPMDCFLILRGIKTLHVRMEKHVKNAQLIAQFLTTHPKVEKVIYPGLESHKDYKLCQKQMSGPGGMISLVVKGGLPFAEHVLKSTQIFACAESLGGVESLIE